MVLPLGPTLVNVFLVYFEKKWLQNASLLPAMFIISLLFSPHKNI